jgi:hypothetical protein
MTFKRALTITVIGGALAAWFAGAATSMSTPPREPIIVTSPPIDTRGAALAGEVARLHERLRPTVSPRQPGRNLFTFHAAPVRPPSPVVAPAPTSAAPIAEPAVAPAPVLTLAGIGEDPGDDGPRRTAIISSPGQLFVVKEGEAVTARYRVARIAADVVELTDLIDGSTRTLALR